MKLKPWVLVPNGSFMGFFEWVRRECEHMRNIFQCLNPVNIINKGS